jgi:type III pantothenate kinase
MIRIVADLGNSRLKWGRVGASSRLESRRILPSDDPDAWASAWQDWNPAGAEDSRWAIATVNPPEAKRLGAFLGARGVGSTRWYRSAAGVPIRHALEQPETAGADRALAVVAARAMHPPGRPGLVVSCGSAITVERITADAVWQGGAIAPGLGLSARALHILTAQLPLITPRKAPPAWGRSTGPALEAGLYWSVVGAVRELLKRQAADLSPDPWVVWTGGDAPILGPAVAGEAAFVVDDLVLHGLIHVAFGGDAG